MKGTRKVRSTRQVLAKSIRILNDEADAEGNDEDRPLGENE